jgi:predicted  nucleic acid-binding Zn-ribbon protein
MLGLRTFACTQCDTVYALPDAPEACARCGENRFEPVGAEGGAAAYFSAAMVRDRAER